MRGAVSRVRACAGTRFAGGPRQRLRRDAAWPRLLPGSRRLAMFAWGASHVGPRRSGGVPATVRGNGREAATRVGKRGDRFGRHGLDGIGRPAWQKAGTGIPSPFFRRETVPADSPERAGKKG